MRRRVVVTGLGCVSPVGNNVKDTWRALLAGRSGAAPITTFDASAHKTKFAAEVKGFAPEKYMDPKEARRRDRFEQFSIVSAKEALTQSGLQITEANAGRIGVII